MRSKTPLKSHLDLHNTQNQFASGSSNLVKPLAKVAASHIRHPAFSDESSETEYTSTSSEEVFHENENSIESKPKDKTCNQGQSIQATHENVTVLPISHIESGNLVISQQVSSRRISPLEGGVLNGQAVLHPSLNINRVGNKCTSMKERHAIDRNGKAIILVELDDSDEETDAPFRRQPLCSSCQEHMHHKQHEPQVTKAAEKDEVHTPKVTLVVDLSATSSLKGNGNQVETKFTISKEHVKLLPESPLKRHSCIAFSPEVLKSSIEKVKETVLLAAEESEDEASTLSDDYKRGHDEGLHAERIPPDWSPGVLCDLCKIGASLSLGPWYSWCCGNPSLGCSCSFDDLQRKKKAVMGKGGKNWKTTDPPYPWSGKVHKLCGLWSAEVFEDSKHPWRIMKLEDAIRRSRKIKCSDLDCGLFGATLGCRVASCKRSFHYPCADRLSAFLKVRMWDGLMKPVACKEHWHVDDFVDDVKSQKEGKKRKRGKKGTFVLSGAGSSKVGARISDGADVFQIESIDAEGISLGATVQDVIRQWKTPNSFVRRVAFTNTVDSSERGRNAGPAYLGKNLLCRDFSGGLEVIEVPCTNDVDDELPPYLEYITKSRYRGQPLGSRTCSHPHLERRAKACNGCALHDIDDPSGPVSVHIPFQRRADDFREDWLRERMYGRLPYDKNARLVIGTDCNELVECNDRCKCGEKCINREMQKGLRTPIELYKTINKGWAVRTLVPIPRGRFVIEYVGEMLTQDQAVKCGQIYDEIKRSYLYDLDYPESKRTPDFTLDGYHASNVARFINHSCDPNLKNYRVYVETTYKWLSHIGMYAMRDIEAGEELSYDYNYGKHEVPIHDGKSSLGAGKQKIEQKNDSTYIKCYCGAKNCREWLWRPTHTGEGSEDEYDEQKDG